VPASGLTAVPASAGPPPGLYLNAVKASPEVTYGQKFLDVFANGTGESVHISVAPVVAGLTVTINDSVNASGPCTPDGAPWTWTCAMSQPQSLGAWFLRFTAATSVPEGTSVTSTFTDDVAGLTTSAPVTFKRQAYTQPGLSFDTDPTTGAHQLSVSLLDSGPQDATSSSLTMTGLTGLLTPTLPNGCQRSGDTITCDTGPIAHNATAHLSFPVDTSVPWFDVTATSTVQPNGWGDAPVTITYHFALPVQNPPAPSDSPIPSNPPDQPGSGSTAPAHGAGGGAVGGGAVGGGAAGDGAAGPGGIPLGNEGPSAGTGVGAPPGLPVDAGSSPVDASAAPVAAPAHGGGSGLLLLLLGVVVVLVAGIATAVGLRRRGRLPRTPVDPTLSGDGVIVLK
jgi:hypothetical protein